MAARSPSVGRILELDGLRAISVCLVILHHLVNFVQVTSTTGAWQRAFVFLGSLGVDVFFVISGYIITLLMKEEFRSEKSVSLARFYWKRIFRILPAYWFYIAVTSLLGALGVIWVSGKSVFWSLLFLSNTPIFPVNHDGAWFMAHSWSLSVEEQYYVLFPLLLWKILRGNITASTVVLSGAYVFFALSRIITHAVNAHWTQVPFDIDFLFEFKFIIAGVLLALHQDRLQGLCRGLNFLVPILALAFLIGGGIDLLPLVSLHYLCSTIDALIIAFLVLWTIQNPDCVGFLRWAPVQWVGACSYSVYLWQQLFTGPSSQYLALPLNRFPLSIVLIFAAAAFSYYFIERKFIGLGRRLLEKDRAPGK